MDDVGQVTKQIGSSGFYANVSVMLTPGSERRVSLAYTIDDEWYRSQGWLAAAITGVSLGLDLASATGDCIVTRIHGMPCDTSSGLVTLAGIRAVWAAVPFVPSEALADAVESCILRGHRLSPNAVGAELALVSRLTAPSAVAET